VWTFSNGHGEWGRDAIVGVFLDENGQFQKSTKVDDLKDEENRKIISEAIRDTKPDVIGVSGFSVQTSRLYEDLIKLVEDYNITVSDEVDDEGRSPIEVIYVNDEVARLYQHSDRAKVDHPELAPLVRYCCALGRYLQSPLLEYAALGKDVVSIPFHPAQKLLNPDKLWKSLETALVDMVNLCGVYINEAVTSPYVANLLPYVCGLGPRKASHVLKIISSCVSFDIGESQYMKLTSFSGRKNPQP
jgi:transcription elongation factor SPT6